MKLYSKRQADYKPPVADRDSRLVFNASSVPLIDGSTEARKLTCLVVDDRQDVLRVAFRSASSIGTKISAASKSAPESTPLLTFDIVVPETRRSDLDSLSDEKLVEILQAANSNLSSLGMSINPDSISSAMTRLRSQPRPHGATDGLEALLLCAAIGVDLVITDLDMPNLNGHGLLNALNGLTSVSGINRSTLPNVAVISGAFESCTTKDLIGDGASVVGIKPLDSAEFTTLINYSVFGVATANPAECFEVRE